MARMARVILAGVLAIAPVASPQGLARAAAAQVLFSDGFHDPTTTSPVAALNGDNPGLPCLTAGADTGTSPVPGCGGSTDPAGSGVLRLNDNQYDEDAALVYQPGLSLGQGLSVEFKLYMYGGPVGGQGDGVSFDLAVAPPPPGQLGPLGGALGYSSNVESQPGLPAGWLGVGFDTYGNYTPASGQPEGCSNAGGPLGGYPNAVSVRGPGNGSTGYCLLSSTGFGGTPLTFQLDGTDRPSAERGANIVIDPTAGTYTIGIDPTGGTTYSTVTSGALPTSYYDQLGNQQTGLPAQLTFVVTGTTGNAGRDYHEISDLRVSTLQTPSTPSAPAPTQIHHSDHAGSNDPNANTNPTTQFENPTTTTTATTANPTVSTPCHGSCSLNAVTGDEHVTIDATDTGAPGGAAVVAFRPPAIDSTASPVLYLTINGGGAKPRCPGYRTRDRNWVQFAFESGGSTYRKTGTMTSNRDLPRAGAETLLDHEQVCFSAPYRFPTRPGFAIRKAGGGFDGVLPDCAASSAPAIAGPCVSDRSLVRIGNGWGVRLVFRVPPGREDPKALG